MIYGCLYLFPFLSLEIVKIFILQFGLAVACLVVVKLLSSPYSYLVGSLFIAASSYFAYKELDKRLDIKSVISGIKNRF